VIALQHAGLGDVGKPRVRSELALFELGRLDQPAVQGRHDLRAGKRVHRGSHAREQVDGDAHGPELQPLEVVGLGDRLLVPAQRLVAIGPYGKDTTLAPMEV